MSEVNVENLKIGENSPEHEEIARLEQELEQKKRALAGREPSSLEKAQAMPERNFEVVSPTQAVTPPSVAQSQSVAVPYEEIKRHAEDIKKMNRQQQVDRLAKIAIEKGPDAALKIAQRLDNPWLLDQYHDTLTDEIYQELLKRGHIKH